ncbi:exocyst subunit [Ophidiomyces ophidiicola]|nr:exocyst subunit [Ophidiomyces ophidiicola]KAI2018077.1 exocyst subunit [Ophidiomyces ophidiicola]KAI2134295.1 exocyst subunit [Ophidiomyces ophidiicola]KAI2136697.1 exocyst subunit [Ophidiomyces ophidiicola]KAI2218815.1 exocyst subunit [Ophidiomyces ophidiicola]
MNARNGLPFTGSNPNIGPDQEYSRKFGNSTINPLVTNNSYAPSSHERRAGGYGGFYETQRPDALERDRRTPSAASRSRVRDDTPTRNQYNDSGQYGTARSDGSSGFGRGPQVDDVIQVIQQEWEVMSSNDCIPVQVGLQLMDSSTLGQAQREPDFLQIHKDMKTTLKAIVNGVLCPEFIYGPHFDVEIEHHQGFSSAIGTYHRIQSSIQDSQDGIQSLKSTLVEAKSGLLTTNPELQGLATSSQSYNNLLQLLARIEHIQSLPETLEAHISEKRFLSAVEILKEALGALSCPEFKDIPGLGDLRTYFANQDTSLTEILIEELHDHLYLKSPYCQDRWKAPVENSNNGSASPSGIATWDKPVYRFLSSLNASTPLTDDASNNPEADTFSYIHLIIETLDRMGNMEIMVDRIEQRLPVELYAVVDKTSSEVAARYPDHIRAMQKDTRHPHRPLDAIEEHGHVLSEFLWNLYSKFEAIAEGHRVVHDIITGITEREDNRKGTLGNGFKELWKLYQSEKLFKLSEVDQNSTDMKAEQADLDEILRSSVPGLVSKSRKKLASSDLNRSNQESSGTGHKLLISPNIFNISLLLPPALSFIQRLANIVPEDSDVDVTKLTTFLDDFMTHVFQPQLEEAVTELCTICFIATDSYTEDPQWNLHSTRPIFKGTIIFTNLVRKFSLILDSIPHDQAFTRLLLTQMVTYYDKCYGWYKALVSRVSSQPPGGIRLKTAASFAESGETRDTTLQLWESSGISTQELINQEIDLLINRTNATPLEPYDIISDPKTVYQLSLLYNSMHWLASSLSKLRHITPYKVDSSRGHSRQLSSTARRWTISKTRSNLSSEPPRLPLTEESVIGFDTAVESVKGLALTALLTLHMDIRCGAIHMVSRSLKGNSISQPGEMTAPPSPTGTAESGWIYILSSQPTSASPTILELNNDLISFDASVSSSLGPKEHRFITSGLAKLIDRALMSATKYIGAMNSNGALKLQLDVLVLQQNLKNIIISSPMPPTTPKSPRPDRKSNTNSVYKAQETVALPRSAKFLDWFLEGPDKAVQYAKEEKEAFRRGDVQAIEAGNGEPFTYDELKILVELCFSAVLKGPRGAESREDFLAAKRGSGDALLRLSEVMWNS